MKIEVTLEDIQRSVRASANACAVARACNRAFPGCWASVLVDTVTIVDPRGVLVEYILPDEATEWIIAHDKHERSEPISFDLI